MLVRSGNRCFPRLRREASCKPLAGLKRLGCVAEATRWFRLPARYFFLLRQEKVPKKKATPGCAVGYADSPALLESGGGCGTRRYAAQTVLALVPPASALLGAPQGERENHPELKRSAGKIRTLFPLPSVLPSSADGTGGSRRGLFEGRRPEFRSRPGPLSSAGHPAASGARLRARLLFAYFLLARQEKVRRAASAENNAN